MLQKQGFFSTLFLYRTQVTFIINTNQKDQVFFNQYHPK